MKHRTLRIALILNTERRYARATLTGIERYREEFIMRRKDGMTWDMRLFPAWKVYLYHDRDRQLADWRPDGIVAEAGAAPVAAMLQAISCPVVTLTHVPKPWHFASVLLDDLAIGTMAADHLLGQRFKHLAFYWGHYRKYAELRLAGFCRRLAAAGKDVPRGGPSQGPTKPDLHIFRTDWIRRNDHGRTESGRKESWIHSLRSLLAPNVSVQSTAEWLAHLPRPVGVFAACDEWGVQVLDAARTCGLRVPEDVAVLGVEDDDVLCPLASPPLSSILTNHERLGYQAAALLYRLLIGGQAPAQPILIEPVAVMVRKSSDILHVADSCVAQALAYIRQNADRNIAVKSIISHLGVNRRTLDNHFRDTLGRSVHEELLRVRLERVQMLLHRDMSIGHIAVVLDFPSSQHLARTFKRVLGVSPTAYRRQMKK